MLYQVHSKCQAQRLQQVYAAQTGGISSFVKLQLKFDLFLAIGGGTDYFVGACSLHVWDVLGSQ